MKFLQNFSDGSDETSRNDCGKRLTRLRSVMRTQGLDGFIVPRANQHLGEMNRPCDERLAWISGFSGSAGCAVILQDRAAIFTDGRYQIQLEQQTDKQWFEHHHATQSPMLKWLSAHLHSGHRLGFDAWNHSITEIEAIEQAALEKNAEIVAVSQNLIDLIWDDRPCASQRPLIKYALWYAGQEASEKIALIAQKIKPSDVVLLIDPTSIAWLLNIRGSDIPHTPVALCFALLYHNGLVDLFIDQSKLDQSLRDHLGDRVHIKAPDDLGPTLNRLKRVQLDKDKTPRWFLDQLQEAKIDFAPDPCLYLKAVKNKTELEGMKKAHIRDGLALSQFLFWLSQQQIPPDEISAVKKLEQYRRAQNMFFDISFDTIAGSGEHGAIVHYRVNQHSNRTLREGDLFLLDSGGQYLDGTTDVTRTIAIGQTGLAERYDFTLVLKGHIALAQAVFPPGTSGQQLDALARRPLWEAGYDFDHGTGHGVGAFLSVHEGPQAIAPRGSSVALREGMILSNEPGIYKKNAYGIRIENLIVVIKRDDLSLKTEAAPAMLGFETITCAPIDLALVDPAQLNQEERAWLNAYHLWVREQLTPLMDKDTANWLAHATRAIEI